MPNLSYKQFTLARIDAFIKQIQLIKELDFPYSDSSDALDIISEHIITQREGVKNSVLKDDAMQSRCARATSQLFEFHRFLGYITKSTDPINSFEIYFSFQRLAETILGNNTRLIISSEWEYYSPVNFTIPPELINFVFIGLPVSEAENSLIVPLSGHELGHSIWNTFNFKDNYRLILQKSLQESNSKSFEDSEISMILEISLIKCEEFFCDFVGIGLFGESYLYAFAYLIAPKISNKLTPSHPNATNRAIAMTKAVKEYGYEVPSNFEKLFKTQLNPFKTKFEKCLEESERLSFNLTKFIIADVNKLLLDKSVLYAKSTDYDRFESCLLDMVPISTAISLADITNAAWDVYFKEDKWKDLKNLNEEEKVVFLNELTIKSFEILEIKQRLQL